MVVITQNKVTEYPHEAANTALVEWAVDENIIEPAVATELRTVYEQSAHFEASQELVRQAKDIVWSLHHYGSLNVDHYDEIMGALQHAEI